MNHALDATVKILTAARDRDGNAARETVAACRKVLLSGAALTAERADELAAAMDLLGINTAAFADDIRAHLARAAEYKELRAKVAGHSHESWAEVVQKAEAEASDLEARAAAAKRRAVVLAGDARAWSDLKDKAEAFARRHPEVTK